MQIFRNRRKDIKPTMEGQNKSLFQLFVPLCLETIFYMLSGMVDTLMLSSVGDQAVGAVGTANTYIGVFIIMYSVVSMGMLAVMTQNIGAGRPGIACQAKTLGLWFNGILGVAMSVFCFLFRWDSVCGRYCTGIEGACCTISADRRRRKYTERYDSHIGRISACIWIYETASDRNCDR